VLREKHDSFASAIQANATRTSRETHRYQNDTTWVIRERGSNLARHIKTEVRTFRRAEVFALLISALASYRLPITDY
jgi:hypothetical protein